MHLICFTGPRSAEPRADADTSHPGADSLEDRSETWDSGAEPPKTDIHNRLPNITAITWSSRCPLSAYLTPGTADLGKQRCNSKKGWAETRSGCSESRPRCQRHHWVMQINHVTAQNHDGEIGCEN